MPQSPHQPPRRKALRHPGHDYTLAGAYFVTVCTVGREPILAQLAGGTLVPTEAGLAARDAWCAMRERFASIELDESIFMPNHMHAILWLNDECGDDPVPGALALGTVMRAYKSVSARAVNALLDRQGPVWQRGYYDRVIRDDDELVRIREYIMANPDAWAADRENPDAVMGDREHAVWEA